MNKRPATVYLRVAMIAVALIVPAASLTILGSIWLWQKGYLLVWGASALALTLLTYLAEYLLVRRLAPSSATPVEAAPNSMDTHMTAQEFAAWSAVEDLAKAVEPSQLTNRDAVLDLGLRTIETVARSMFPQDANPVWRFTVPEVLALVERVSHDLGPFVTANIPLGDQLTVGQVMKIYQWRGVAGLAGQAYDLWRIIRLANPVAAVATEARERLTKSLYTGVRDELARRLAQAYVREVGRASIDLYSGRLRVTASALQDHVTSQTVDDRKQQASPEPIRILFAGQINAGKSSLINALCRDTRSAVDILPTTDGFATFELGAPSLPPLMLIDSPGASSEPRDATRLLEAAGTADLIIWVAAANRADRALDRATLDGIRRYYDQRPDRRRPPILGVATHIDALRPFGEWAPPYDLNDPSTPKVRNIAEAIAQAAQDLAIAKDQIVPVSLASGAPAYNIEAVWLQIEASLPAISTAHLVRKLRDASRWSWTKVWKQTVNAAQAGYKGLTGAPQTRR